MPRHDGAHGIPVMQRQLTAIHLVRDQHFALERLLSGQTASVRDRPGRDWWFRWRSAVGSLEHNLDGVVIQPGPPEQGAQRDAGPFCVADGAELPLCPRNLRDKKDAPIPRALERCGQRL